MKIGVLSDTHDQYDNILKVVEILNKEKVELVVHCGDWVSPFTIGFYKDLKCQIKGVFGNNDGDRFLHPLRAKSFGVDVEYEERVLKLNLDGRIIFVYHGDYVEGTNALVSCGKYDAVFHGHTHKAVNKQIRKTLSLNAGTLMPFTDDETKDASFAIYETKLNTAKLIKL